MAQNKLSADIAGALYYFFFPIKYYLIYSKGKDYLGYLVLAINFQPKYKSDFQVILFQVNLMFTYSLSVIKERSS